MRPAVAIAMLDRQLAAHGSPISLRREGASPLTADVLGFPRRADPKNLAAGISQDVRSVTISPTGLDGWEPLPRKGDLLRVGAGAFGNIEAAEVVSVAGVPVRINLIVMDAG